MPDNQHFIQINLHRCQEASALLHRKLNLQSYVALIQEPYTQKNIIRNLNGTNYNIFSGCSQQIRPRTCICLPTTINALQLHKYCNQDLVAVQISVELSDVRTNMVIASAYFPYDDKTLPPDENFVKLVEFCEKENLPLLAGCDANSHHIIWGSTDVNRRGRALVEYLAATNLELLNVGHEHTFITRTRRETIDITLASNSLKANVRDWRVSLENSLSDHRYICFTILINTSKPSSYRNPRSTNWVVFKNALAESLPALPPLPNTTEKITKLSESIQSAIISSFELSCPVRGQSSGKDTSWWNNGLQRLKKNLRKSFNRARKRNSQSDWDIHSGLQREYKKQVKHARLNAWKRFCSEIEGIRPSARVYKALSKDPSFKPGSILKTDGTYTKSDKETAEFLFASLFPGCKSESNNPNLQLHLAEPNLSDWYTANQIVSREKIKHAIQSFADYKSPGADGIQPVFLKKGMEIIIDHLVILFKSCLAFGFIPPNWRISKVSFIPKPGRITYTLAKSFRPISLSSFLLKTLERLIDWHIRVFYLKNSPLHPNQHAYQKGKSVETALNQLVSKIEKCLDQKEYALCTFLDIEGAFDKTSVTSICSAAQSHGIPPTIIRFLSFMLKNRLVYADTGSGRISVTLSRGCPQGGVLSPILWLLVIDNLINNLNLKSYYTQAYADDLVIFITGKCLSTISGVLQSAVNIVQSWCTQNDLSVNATKSELILFTKKRNTTALRSPILFGNRIPIVKKVKYLGVILDEKLSWREHLDYKVKKANAVLWQCRTAIGRTWGLSPKVVRWIFTAIARPTLTFGAIVWWPRVKLEISKCALNHLQRVACVGITGAMRSAPTSALEILAGLEPLHIHVQKIAKLSALRLYTTQQWKGREVGHGKILFDIQNDNPFFGMQCDMTTPVYCLESNFSICLTTLNDWVGKGQTLPPRHGVVCYTDGSVVDCGSGYGVYCEEPPLELSGSLGGLCTVFQTEIFAILQCVTSRDISVCKDSDIFVCSDSQAALLALSAPVINSSLVLECRTAIMRLGSNNNVRLLWVPSHSGIAGNERADELARSGSGGTFCGPEPVLGISFTNIRTAVQKLCEKEHLNYWNTIRGCFQTKQFIKGPLKPDILKALLNKSKNSLRLITGVITGHSKLNKHLHTIGVIKSPFCEMCLEEEVENVEHFLLTCPAFCNLRRQIFGQHILDSDAIPKIKLHQLDKFITQSKRFETKK